MLVQKIDKIYVCSINTNDIEIFSELQKEFSILEIINIDSMNTEQLSILKPLLTTGFNILISNIEIIDNGLIEEIMNKFFINKNVVLNNFTKILKD